MRRRGPQKGTNMSTSRAIIIAGALIALGIAVQPIVRWAAVTPAEAQSDFEIQPLVDFLTAQHERTMTGLEQIYERLGETNDLLNAIAGNIDRAAPRPQPKRQEQRR